jgi:hypothetical protein
VSIGGKRRLMGIVSRARDPDSPCTSGTIHARLDAESAWIAAAARAL